MSEGSQAEFKCNSKSEPKWTFQNTNLPPNAQPAKAEKEENHILKISNARISNTGTYACHGENNNVPFTGNGELNVQRMFI